MGNAILQRVGNVIRDCRRSQNLTQEQLAELVGTSYTYIGSLERGERNVTIKTLERIGAACNMDVFTMFKLESEDETLNEIMALLVQCDDFDRKKSLQVLREIFKPRP
ncbi:helix-turn-helix transcriptional regulator [Cohnella nanjingensis]|uniref:Helix-turn-helix transcriptional regulator n=1 Tax=Cohnella nanjingensis TaxID=1387779 RepID=A0A7X0RWE0_9BACL|nr:helix-turn-helix transcriptional regulator [Cohnella nanjingensis]